MKTVLIILGVIFVMCVVLLLILKNNKLKVAVGSLLLLIVMFVSGYFCIPIFKNINYGLDLQGGFEVLYEIEPLEKDSKLTYDMVYNTYKAILKRVDILGVNEPEIAIEDDNRIRIALAGVTNEDEARDVISSTASLSFRDANDNLLMTADVLGGSVKVSQDQYGRPAVSLPIKDKDTFYEVTSKVKDMTNNVIVIWLDYNPEVDSYYKEKDKCGSLSSSRCLSAARVESAFSSDVIISGNFTTEEAKSLVELINSGSLPTKLNEISSHTVEASYGENSLSKTLIAGVIGLSLVFLTLIVLYRFSGLIASAALSLYTMLSFLVFYLINGTLTLPGIAAMLLGIGMAVDASVISFERIKDQLKIGNQLKEAVALGNKDSLSSIIDANITTFIVAIILFIFGQSSVKGFATMLIINIVLTILILVFLAKNITLLFAKSDVFNGHSLFFIGLPKKKIIPAKEIRVPFKKVDFVKGRKLLLIGVTSIIVLGTFYTVFKGYNFAVDFTGGTNITINTSKNVSLDNYNIIKRKKGKDTQSIVISEKLDKEEIKELTNTLEEKYHAESDIYVVSDMVKTELIKNAIIALLIAILGIIVYVSLRFKFNYAISGIIALLHDILITIIFFGIFKIEINSIFIAAILTIIGYSINDTIVTFDMIRKNYNKKVNKEELKNVVNNSVRLTLFRSIITTLTTIMPVISLIIFGANEIINFNIALLVGFIAGLFSSIFISNNLWLLLEEHNIKKPKKEKKSEEAEEIRIKGINC